MRHLYNGSVVSRDVGRSSTVRVRSCNEKSDLVVCCRSGSVSTWSDDLIKRNRVN